MVIANGTGLPLLGTPQEFARGIKDAVNLLRKHVRQSDSSFTLIPPMLNEKRVHFPD